MAAGRAAWRASQPTVDPSRVVFVDETAVNTAMARRYGRGPKGRRVVDAVPAGHWKSTTFVAALWADGLTAPMVIDGAMTGDVFVAYVEQVLVPALRPGGVVVWDDLSRHRWAEAAAAIVKAGCRVRFLPPYSPDLNPIELAFAKIKARLRAAGRRTVEGLRAFRGRVLVDFAPAECQNYIRHCGYAATTEFKLL